MTETDILKEIYTALNRNDIPKVLSFFDANIVRVEFEGTPSAGTFRGLSEVEAHFHRGRTTWAEGGCYPEHFTVTGNKVMAFVHVKVRLKDRTDWLEGNTADVFTFRNGKVIEMRTFADNQEALNFIQCQ